MNKLIARLTLLWAFLFFTLVALVWWLATNGMSAG